LLEKLKAGFKHAFAVEPPDYAYTAAERQIVDKLAGFIVRKSLTAPAIVFLKSSAPLNAIGSQLLVFIGPFATLIFKPDEYRKFTEILEHRNSIDFIVERIEEAERAFRSRQKDREQDTAEKEVGEGT
jgi:hypothetical protein